jgi:hypothetical protein
MVTNQYICIFESHSSPYLIQEFICSHLSVPQFTPSYNEIITSIWVISAKEAYCRNRQRKLTRCRPNNLAAKTGSLQAAPFGSENCFIVGATISTANPTSLQPTRFRQRMLIRCKQLNSGNESQIRCKQYNFGSESQIRCRTHNLAANVNSLQIT